MDLKKQIEPVIIVISAVEAYITGAHRFYQATDLVWLTDYIHPNFMRLFRIKNPRSYDYNANHRHPTCFI